MIFVSFNVFNVTCTVSLFLVYLIFLLGLQLKSVVTFRVTASPFSVAPFPLGFMSVKESIHCRGRTQNISFLYILELLFLLLFLLRATVVFLLPLWNITFLGLPDNVSLASFWEINGERTSEIVLLFSRTKTAYSL